MKKELLLVSMVAAMSFAACSKKEETTTVTPAAPAVSCAATICGDIVVLPCGYRVMLRSAQ